MGHLQGANTWYYYMAMFLYETASDCVKCVYVRLKIAFFIHRNSSTLLDTRFFSILWLLWPCLPLPLYHRLLFGSCGFPPPSPSSFIRLILIFACDVSINVCWSLIICHLYLLLDKSFACVTNISRWKDSKLLPYNQRLQNY